jgi:hypothetical protein
VPRVARRAASNFVYEWRIPCGRRPPLKTMFSTSTRCCTPARSSIIRVMFWRNAVGFGETRHPSILGIRRIGDRFLPFAAGTGRPQGPRHHRRDPGSLVRTRWRPPQSAWRQAEPPVFYVKGAGGLVGRSAMDEIRLPQHVVSRIERRWTARFAKMLAPCRPERSLSKRNDTLRSPKFRRR